MNADTPTEKCYRFKRSLRKVSWVCLLFYSSAAIGSSWVALANPDGSFARPVASAIFFGVFWSVWALLSLWLLCACYRERLFLGSDRITEQGLYFRRSLAISELSSVCWRGVPRQRGSVVLRTSSARVVIGFGNYEPHEQDEIIAFVRQYASPEITTGWEAFVNSHLPQPQLPPSRWVAALCGLIFLVTGCMLICYVLIYGWQVGLGLPLGLTGLACLLCAVWYVVRIVRFQPPVTPIV